MDTALIGCGFIGTLIAEHISKGDLSFRLRYVLDRNEHKVNRIISLFSEPPLEAKKIDDVIHSKVDLVIEAASIGAVQAFAEPVLSSGKDMMIMSVGAFADEELLQRVENICARSGARVFLPSGALGALDAVYSARQSGLDRVELTTIKHPRSLEGAPYLGVKGIRLKGLKKKKLLFKGTAAEAIKGFPSNVNVAIALSLAGIGARKTMVKIIADPDIDIYKHP